MTLEMTSKADRLLIQLPAKAPDAVASVIVLDLAEEPVAAPIQAVVKAVTGDTENQWHPAAVAGDGNPDTFWLTADESSTGVLEFDLGEPTPIHGFEVAEPDFWPRYYQALRLEILIEDGSWKEVANLSTAGHGAKGTFEPAVASRVRLHVKRHNGWAGIAELFLFRPE